MFSDSTSGAAFGPDRIYRYRLWRTWDRAAPRCIWIMLNPSTADEHQLDPTIRRCVGYSRGWGYGSLEILNLFALRSTDPRRLYEHDDPVGPGNNLAIIEVCREAPLVVCGWGTHGSLGQRDEQVVELLGELGVRPKCLTVNSDGSPGHPLYLKKDKRPMEFSL
jgi:hypothetical protein